MAKILSKSGISPLQIVRPGHVTQSIDAFTGIEAYNISLSGSFSTTGSLIVKGTSTFTSGPITASVPVGIGTNVTANGTRAFAHGTGSNATGDFSFSQGRNTVASGFAAHAEGLGTVALGAYSHAEGRNTLASGSYSHTQGRNTTASGDYTHAGGYGTVASGNYQLVAGQFNILNSTDNSAFIIGDGTSNSSRSNILFAGNNKIELNAPITASNNISSSGIVYMTTASIGGGLFTSASLAAGGGGGSTPTLQQVTNQGSITTTPITASIISSSNTVFGITGSFSHLQGNSPITVGDQINFQQPVTASADISSSGDVQGNSLTTNQYVKHNGDTDTQINFLDDEIRFEAGNLLLFDLHKKGSAPHEVTVNTGGNNVDFIIKDDDSTPYLIADASTTRVGIGEGMTTPTATLHISGAGNVNIHVEGHMTASGDISSSANIYGNSSTAGPVITLKRNSATPDDADYLGQLKFKGENDNEQEVVYAKITGKISDASDTTEDGIIEYALQKAGSNTIVSRLTSTDLKLINGTGLEVNGNISTDGTSSAAYFNGDGSNLTNLQRPISNSVSTNFTASNLNSGFYFRAGGNVTCSLKINATASCNIGNEFELFQTSSAGYVLIKADPGVTLNSKGNKTKLAGQFSGATLKKVGTNEWDLIGDLG
jgi:hypothetical protein